MTAILDYGSASSFPVKLHFMLNDLKSDGLEAIAEWQPDGRCFIVHNPTFFMSKVLPL